MSRVDSLSPAAQLAVIAFGLLDVRALELVALLNKEVHNAYQQGVRDGVDETIAQLKPYIDNLTATIQDLKEKGIIP